MEPGIFMAGIAIGLFIGMAIGVAGNELKGEQQ